MKSGLFLCFILLSGLSVNGQISGAFGQVGINTLRETYGSGDLAEVEYALRTSIGLDVGKYVSTGLKLQQLWYRGSGRDFQNMWLAGPFVRIGSPIEKDFRFLGELGFMRGNYCVCERGLGESYRKDGLNYIAWGGGMEYRIKGGIYINADIFFHHIINAEVETFGYNGYLLGLVFHLSRGNLSG